jgi:hypothetical protein
MRLKLGKKPARAGAVPNQFSSFFSAVDLPPPPLVFGRPELIRDWGMLGNDICGNCGWCDPAHSTMYWNAIAGKPVPQFTPAAVISDYSAETGYVPGNQSTDQGSDLGQVATYWKNTGVIDASGVRHKIDASLSLRVGDLNELALATYLFGCVSLGVQLPSSAEDQFDQAIPWTLEGSSSNEGGHCTTCVGRNSANNFLVVTWGRLQAVTPAWIAARMDEGVLHLSEEMIKPSDKLSPRGYDKEALLLLMGKL